MNHRSSTFPKATASTVATPHKAAGEAARRISEAWRRDGAYDLPAALSASPVVLQDRSVFLDLAQEEYRALKSRLPDHSASAFCGRFTGLTPDLRASLYRLIEVEQYLSDFPDLSRLTADIDWPSIGDGFAEFEIVEELGRGAIGRAYRCLQRPVANREVVVKVTCSPGVEAANLGRLQHRCVVPIYGTGIDVATGLGWICMPYLGRRTLGDLVADPDRSFGRVSIDDAVRLFHALADALAYVHSRGILHGDLKPSNVLVPSDGVPMLIDFNLAVRANGDTPGPAGGTLRYMAPEQLRSLEASEGCAVAQATSATEVFAFAVMLTEILLGESPFDFDPSHDRVSDAAKSIRQSQVERRAEVGRKLERIDGVVARLIRRCLQEDAADRPSDFREIAAQLRRSIGAVPRLHRFTRRRPRSAAAILLVGLGLLAAATLGLQRMTDDDPVQLAREHYGAGRPRAAAKLLAEFVATEDAVTAERRLLAHCLMADAKFKEAGDQYLTAWREENRPADVAMAAYCRNRTGKHSAAIGLYEMAHRQGYSSLATQTNYASSTLVTLQWSFDESRSRIVEQCLLKAFGIDPENETVRVLMLRHYLLASQEATRRRPDYPMRIAALPEQGGSVAFCIYAARFLAARTSDQGDLTLLGRPLIERIAALNGVPDVATKIGRKAASAYESLDWYGRLSASPEEPRTEAPPLFLHPEKRWGA